VDRRGELAAAFLFFHPFYVQQQKTQMTNPSLDDDDFDDDGSALIRSNRARRNLCADVGNDRKAKLSDATLNMIREARNADAQVDVFNPSFKGKQFEENWLLESLGDFYHNHLIADVLGQVKGGKEANVYRCSAHPQLGVPLLAAKVYRPRMFRNLKNDAEYRAGGTIKSEDGKNMLKKREAKAVSARSKVGLKILHTTWLQNEYAALNKLRAAGVRVPQVYGVGENAILMTYLGDAVTAAPPLASVSLPRGDAGPMFESLVEDIRRMLAEEVIHGDLSAYNILYWEGQPCIIDFPQAVHPWKNPSARRFFERDVTRVCEYFASQGVRTDAGRLTQQLWGEALP
jgi:RIO kinase 1